MASFLSYLSGFAVGTHLVGGIRFVADIPLVVGTPRFAVGIRLTGSAALLEAYLVAVEPKAAPHFPKKV